MKENEKVQSFYSTGWGVQGCQPGMAMPGVWGCLCTPRSQRKDASFGVRTVLMYQG